jgi:hypothetical protein
MNTQTALDLIAARQTAATTAAEQLREQIAALTAELARVEGELTDLETTHKTLLALSAEQTTAPDPTLLSEPYQQILAVFRNATGPLRAKDVCLALGLTAAPKNTESLRARLKRLVRRQVLTETKPGQFTLDPTAPAPDQHSNR